VLRLRPTDVAIVACLARPESLGGVRPGPIGVRLAIAPDEVWLVGRLDQRQALMDAARSGLAGRGLVVDQTDGWWVVTASGEDRLEVIRRLMLAPIPAAAPALVQGAITGVPGKVVYESGRLHLFVPAPVGHHLMERLAAVTGDLAVQLESPAPLAFDTPGASC